MYSGYPFIRLEDGGDTGPRFPCRCILRLFTQGTAALVITVPVSGTVPISAFSLERFRLRSYLSYISKPSGALRSYSPVTVGASDIALLDLVENCLQPIRSRQQFRNVPILYSTYMIEVENYWIFFPTIYAGVFK